MKYLSIVFAMLLLASCSTTGMSSGDSMGSRGEHSPLDDCATNPTGMYCGD